MTCHDRNNTYLNMVYVFLKIAFVICMYICDYALTKTTGMLHSRLYVSIACSFLRKYIAGGSMDKI